MQIPEWMFLTVVGLTIAYLLFVILKGVASWFKPEATHHGEPYLFALLRDAERCIKGNRNQ